MIKYRIHPAIGIARVGNSTSEHFVGPRIPDVDFAPPGGTYRDGQGRDIRRQGCEFRIYEYTYAGPSSSVPTSVREITDTEAEITWHVHMANLKPRNTADQRVPLDPGEKNATGPGQSAAPGHSRNRASPRIRGAGPGDRSGSAVYIPASRSCGPDGAGPRAH